MTTTTTPDALDLDALRADAERHLAELREQRARLSLDAIGDAEIRQELESVESEIASLESEIQRFDLAGTEQARRQTEAEREAEEKRLAAARAVADRHDRELGPAAKLVDEAAQGFAAAVSDYNRIYQARELALIDAGLREWGSSRQPGHLGSALRFHLQAAGVLRAVDVRDNAGGPDRPLADPKGAKP
jgi:hypothetical protein